jgi:hypothetical protein
MPLRVLDNLDDLEIASPCSMNWDAMVGDGRVRHCGSCEKNVYNLSAMTKDEALNLVRELEGKMCVRLYRRTDGTVIHEDCPVGVAAMLKRAKQRTWKMAAAAFALVAGGLGFAGSRPATPVVMGATLPVRATMGEAPMMGAPMPPEPLMGDIAPPVHETMGKVAMPEAAQGGLRAVPPPQRPKVGRVAAPKHLDIKGEIRAPRAR